MRGPEGIIKERVVQIIIIRGRRKRIDPYRIKEDMKTSDKTTYILRTN